MTCKTALEHSDIKTKISFLEINSSENKNKINGTKKVFSEINIFCPLPPKKKNKPQNILLCTLVCQYKLCKFMV